MSPFLHPHDFAWHEPPGHARAYSQYLVSPEGSGSAHLDFRLSRYPKGGSVARHLHESAEHVYYFTAGEALASCGDEARTVGAGDLLFVPAGVEHSVESTGDDDLCFVLVTSPPSGIERVANPVEVFATVDAPVRGELQVIARWQAPAGAEAEVAAVLDELASSSRAEAGCRRFEVLSSLEREGVFVLVEEYRDGAAFEAHRASAHFQALVLGRALALGVERDVERLERVAR